MLRWVAVEELMVRDEHFAFTIVSYVGVLFVFVNQVVFGSVVLGFLGSVLFLFVDSLFLGHVFFRGESGFVRFVLGGLVLFLFLGVVGWVVLIVYNLDVVLSTVVLGVLAGVSSLLNRVRLKRERGRVE